MNERSVPREAVARFAQAVILRELHRLHAEGLATNSLTADLVPDDRDLELDSLQALGVFGALAQALTVENLGPRSADAKSMEDWVACALALPCDRLTIETSGSTGAPQLHTHPSEHLMAEADWFAEQLPAIDRVISLVPCDHLYGLIWTALLPAILEVPVVPAKVGSLPAAEGNDLVVAVPEQWAAIARIPRRWAEGTVGVSSAGRLDDETARAVLARGLPRLLDIYGASETGAIAMRDAPQGRHTLLPWWSIEDGQDGKILAGRSMRIDLPDRVDTASDGSIVLMGRRDQAVSIGGTNVYPGRVAESLRSVDGVAEVAVRLDKNGRLKALIVPDIDAEEIAVRDRIVVFVKKTFKAAERPCSISFAGALPRNEMGKLCDWS